MDTLIYGAIGFAAAAASAIVYKSLPYIRFAYPSAKVEAVGNPFMLEKNLNQLMESKNLTSFKNVVNSYKDFSIEGETVEEIHRSLDENLIRAIEDLKSESPKGLYEFYERFVEYLDAFNLKNFLKARMTQKKIHISFFSKRFRGWGSQMENMDTEEMLSFLKERGIEIREDASPLDIDTQIDRYVLRNLLETKVPKITKNAKKEFVERLFDISHIRNMIRIKMSGIEIKDCDILFLGEGREIPEWRFREMFMAKNMDEILSSIQGTSYHDYLKEGYENSKKFGNNQFIELSLDKILLKVSSDISMKNYPFFGPLLKFVIMKYYEVRNLKIISKGIDGNLPKDRIKNLLLMEY